jgi:hypothetical protein
MSFACSPDERSDIRGGDAGGTARPGYRFAHPGYDRGYVYEDPRRNICDASQKPMVRSATAKGTMK